MQLVSNFNVSRSIKINIKPFLFAIQSTNSFSTERTRGRVVPLGRIRRPDSKLEAIRKPNIPKPTFSAEKWSWLPPKKSENTIIEAPENYIKIIKK